MLTGSGGITAAVEKAEGKNYYYISSNELKRIANERNVSFTYQVASGLPHIVYHCIAKDPVSGRTVEGVGELDESVLTTAQERLNPMKLAAIRAFDDAILLLCGFQEYVYPSDVLQKKNREVVKLETAQELAAASAGRPLMPNGVPDVLLVGPMRGQKFSEIKDTAQMTEYIRFLKEHTELVFGGEVLKQVEFLKSL